MITFLVMLEFLLSVATMRKTCLEDKNYFFLRSELERGSHILRL